jgi:sugar/nucleoside kinase (ribokinase family)
VTSRPPDLVLLGNLLVDDIFRADGKTVTGSAGGAVLYAALAASASGCRVGLVSVLGSDYPPEALEALRSRGVDLGGLRKLDRSSIRTWLMYEPGGRRIIHYFGGPTHREMSPTLADLPPDWMGARAFHLSPMPIVHQRELVEGLSRQAPSSRRPFVSIDPHDPVSEDSLRDWCSLLAHADAFFPSQDEIAIDLARPLDLARRLGAGGRLRMLALKRGANGGVLVDLADSSVRPWRAEPAQVVDPTGAGDAFAGAFLAEWLAHGSLELALSQGSTVAARTVSDWGARALI